MNIYEISVNSSDDDDDDDDKDSDSYNQGEYRDQEDDGNLSQETQETHELEDEEDDDDDEPEVERPERGSEAGRALRPRGSLAAPAQLAEYVNINKALSNRKRTTKKKKKKPQPKKAARRPPPGSACQPCRDSRRRCDGRKPRCTSCVKTGAQCFINGSDDDQEWNYGVAGAKEFSIRVEIRKTLEDTRRRRDNFYIKYRDLFEPLLPERNYISKLLGARAQDPANGEANGAPVGGPGPDGFHRAPDTPVEHRTHLEVRDANADCAGDDNVEIVPYKLLEKQPEKYFSSPPSP